MLPLLAGFSQTENPLAVSQVHPPSNLSPGAAEVATAVQSAISNDLVLASPEQPHPYANPSTSDFSAATNLGAPSLATPPFFGHSGALPTNEQLSFDAMNLDRDGESSGELENADGLINVAEFLTQTPQHPALYRLFGDMAKTSDSDFTWDKQELQSRALRLFSIHF